MIMCHNVWLIKCFSADITSMCRMYEADTIEACFCVLTGENIAVRTKSPPAYGQKSH